MNKINTASRIFLFVLAQFCTLNFAFAQNNCLKIGQNVTGLEFKDIFKQCYGWRYPESASGVVFPGVEQPYISGLPKDANGYPTGGIPYNFVNLQTTINTYYTGPLTSIKTFSLRETYQPYALGEYYFFWQGQGTIQSTWNGANNIVITAGSYGTIPVANGYELNFGVSNTGITAISTNSITSDNTPGVHYCRISVTSTTGTPARDPYNNYFGIETKIVGSAPAPNHIRGISIVQPDFGTNAGGYNGGNKTIADGAAARTFVNSGPEHFKTQPFPPAFLNWVKTAPVMRFMGLLGVNSESPADVSWLNVRSYDYYTQTAEIPNLGHPCNYLYLIQLCNMLKIDPWINGFVNSDENYQRNLGQLFRDNLDPSLKVYLEMSNENTWNFAPGFNGPPLINNFSVANGGLVGALPGENTLIAAAAYLENRLWENFGSSWKGEDQDRIIRVVAGQSVNAYQCQQKALYHENRGQRYDVLSLAWYLDQLQTNARAIGQTGTPLQLLNAMIADNNYNNTQDSYTNFPSIAKQLKSHADVAKAKGKKLALYEGGTHHSYSQEGRENWHRSKFIKWLPQIRTFYKSLIDTIRNYPEVELALQFNHFGGNSTLNGTAFEVNDQAFGYTTGIYVDTTASGNKSYTGLEWTGSTINILGTNAHGVWKELNAQNNVWKTNSICNPTVSSDIIGSGLSLDFVSTRSQYVNVTSAALFDPLATANYTIETWVKPAELERQQTIWAYSNGSNVLNSLNISVLNKLEWNIGNGSTILTGPLVESNKWYHVSVVKNGTNVQMYVNGTLVTSGSASGSAGVPTNYTLGASNAGGLANYLRGGLDELRVWNGASLSQSAIRDFMCKKVTPATPNYASLSTYIEFNSIAGVNLMDKKTGLTHGTLVNFVAAQSFGYLQSGAPIGDLSTNIYPGSWANTGLSYTNPVGGDVINVNGIGAGNPDGVHIYVVNQSPTLNTKPQFYTTIAGKYFGVFFANGTNPTYNVNYNYQGNSFASATTGFNRLVKRDAGSDYSWENSGARIDALNRTLITNCTESYRAEYILGVRQNQLIQRPGSGSCISLSGAAIGTFSNFNRPDVYTISFWAKGSNGMLGFRDGFTGREIGYYPTESNQFVARYQDVSLGNQNQILGGFNSSWTHYTYTRDASGLFVYYINGYPSNSINFLADTAMTDMLIGYAKNSSNYVGQIDELSVWKRNLSLTEIRDLMCKKITPAHPSYCDLYAYFRFDEASGTVMENTLGAGNIVFNGPIGWTRSGAALGDESKYNYNAPYVASISYPEGDFVRVTPTLNGNQVGTQVYYVNGDPNYPIYPSTETYPGAVPNRDTSRYFGTYAIAYDPTAGAGNRSYLYEYNYGSNKNINFANEASLRLIRRENNQILNWTNTGINPVIASKTLTYQSPVRNDAHYPIGEFLLAGINPTPFIAPLNGIPTIAGITGKLTLCLGESNSLYRVLATVDRRALSFRWIASNGLSLSNSTTDSVSVTALTAGTQTLTVIGINRYGSSTPFVYTINVQNTGYLSSNITGNPNPCNTSSATYNISGVSPSPIAYIWSVTGDAINPTPSNLTASNTFNFGSGGQSTVRISVYGQYSCGLALINTLNVNNNSLPTTTLGILGDSLCLIDGASTIGVKVLSSQYGTTYTAFDGVTPVATTSGNGGTLILKIPTGILTTFVNKVITIRAQNNLCPLIPVTMATSANIMMGNTLTGAQLAPTFLSPSTVCYNLNSGGIKDFPLVLSSGAVSGVTYTPNYLTFAQPYGEPFEYAMGSGVLATGTSVTMIARPSTFPYWLSFGVPNTLSGLAQAPGCPTQRLTTKTTFTLNNTPEVAIPSKVTGPGKGLRAPGDEDYPVCTGSPTSYYTTAKGGSITQFNQRYFRGAMTNGSANITMSSYSNMTSAQIAINDVVYILGTQTDGSGLPAGNNLPQLDGNGNKIPYFVVAVNSGANTIQLATSRGGGAITMNFSDTNISFWAPITIDIPAGTNTFTIPARFGTLNLGLYSQINFDYASQAPGGVCVGFSGNECHPTQYVASINGNNIQLSVNQKQLDKSAGYFINRGRFTYTAGSTAVTGFGTAFQTEDLADNSDGLGGAILRDINNNYIGEVQSVTNQGALVLKAGAIGSGTGVVVSSTKRIRFTSNGESVVLSAPQDSDPVGFEWTISPKEAVVGVVGATGGGGTYNATTGVFSGNNSDALKNGITITWNGTFSGISSVAVTSSKLTPCYAKSNPQGLPATPGYEQTVITLNMQSQIPISPTPIGFTNLSFCQSQSATNFVTSSKNASGGFQWQLQNAGASTLAYFYGGGPCQWSQTSNVVGDKGVDGNPFLENTAPCQNATPLTNAPHSDNNSIGVNWQPGFTGLATIRVRSLGCGSMSNSGDMRASGWVTAVITIGGTPNPGNINLSGQLQLCQGASPTQQYIASGTNIDQFKYFLRRPGQAGDIDPGLLAYYTFDGGGGYNNSATGVWSLGSAVNSTATGVTVIANKNAVANRAITFDNGGDRVSLGTDNRLNLTNSFSISAWINVTSGNGNYCLYSRGGDWEGALYLLVSVNGTNGRLGVSGNSGTFDVDDFGNPNGSFIGSNFNITGWKHVTYTGSFAAGILSLTAYVDGVLLGSINVPYNMPYLGRPGAETRIGAFAPYGAFNGGIDEVMIHDRILSATDVSAIYALNANAFTDPSDYIGEIDGNTGAATWQTTFSGPAQIGVQAIGCGGSTIRTFDAFISPKPSILGISIADPTGCGNPLASGSITITLASFNPSTFTGSPWAVSWNNDLISDGTATLSGNNTITLNTGLFAGSSITGISTWYNGSAGCNAPISITSRIIVGSSPPSSLIGTSLMSAPQICTASTSSGINVLGSENNVRYYAMIGSLMVSPTVVGTGGNIQLSITGNNILTASGVNQVYQIRTLAFSPGCSLVTLAGVQNITVNGLSAASGAIITGTNPVCNPGTSVVSVGGVNGTIDWQVSTSGAFASTGGTVANYTTPSLTQTSTFRALVTNGACPAITTTSLVVTVNSPVTTTFAYNQAAYCNNLTTVVSPVLSNTVAGGVFTVAPSGLTLNATSGAATINSSSAALYTITYSYTVPGCPALTTTTSMRIGSIPGLAFGFVPTVFCTSSGNQTPGTTFTGLGSGGTFSSTSAGLVFVSTTSGQINIAGSTAGTYPLIYTVSVAGCGNVTSTVGNAITINSIPGTSISYTGTPYCNNVASANVVAVNTVSGGIYTSAPAGLTINSITGLVTPTSSTQGAYTITYSYTIPGCGALTTTTTLVINSLPGIAFNYGTIPFCKNGTTSAITTNTGGGFSSLPAGLLFTNTILGTVDLTASTANTYNITYTVSVAGCGNVTSTVGNAITISGVPTITGTTKTDMTNCGVLDGTVTINGIGNNGMALQYQYGAVAFQTVNSFSGLGAGTYTPSIRYAALNSCSATGASFSISAPNTPSLSGFNLVHITNCALTDGRVTVTGVGGTLPYDFSINGGSTWVNNVGTFSGLSALPYSISIRSNASPACSATGSNYFTVTIPSAPTLVTISGTAPSTCVATDGSATVTGTFGSTTPEYSINGSTWFASNVFTGLGVGTRTAYMRNVGGSCSVTGGNTTLNSPFPRPNFSYGAGPFCNNAAIATVSSSNFTVGGFFNASGITVNATNGTISAGASQGSYTVTYTIPGSGFCTGISTTAGVTINSVPGILFSYTGSPFCKNGGTSSAPSATIGGIGGSYSGTAGLVFADANLGTIDLNASTAGTYNVTHTVSIAGCGNISSTVGSALTINSVPGVNISYISPVCNTATISGVTAINTVSGGIYSATGGLTINSTNGTVNPSGFGGTYTITYSYTIAGCGPQSTTTSLVVTTLPSTPTLSYGAAPYCSSSSPISLVSSTNALNGSFLSTATGFFSVNATNGQITIPQNTVAGVFVVRYDIPAAAGCASVTGNNTITLSGVPNALSITGIPATQCYNAQVVLNATGTLPGASIQWLQDGVAVGTNSAVYTTTGLTNPSYTYVAVLNNGVCTTVASAPMVVNVNVNPTVTGISSSQSFACSSQSVTFNNTGLVGSIVYAVNTGAGFNILPSNIYTFTNTIVGNAFSFVGYAFVAGCQTVTSAPIIVNSSLCGLTAAFTSNPNPVCLSSGVVTITNTSFSNGGTILGYAWTFGGGSGGSINGVGPHVITFTTSGTKNITLSIVGTGGLTSTFATDITIDALSTISGISLPSPICETNNTVNLSVTALGSIQWYKAGVAQGTAGLQAAGAMTSNTTFIATAVNGVCPMVTATGVVTVTNLNLGGNILGATALCASSTGLNLTVTGQVGNSYTWYNSTNSGTTWNTLSSNVNTIATGTLSTTTSYVVSVTGGACPNVASVVVTINVTPTPIAGTASVDRMIVCTSDGNGGIYTLASSSGTIQWERSLDLSSWANAAGAGNTTASLTANVETVIGPKYFRARVTNGGACGDVYSNVITVTASSCGLQAAFTPNLTTVCVSVGNTVRFTDASTSTNTILGYTWDFAGGIGGNVNTAGPHDITFTSAGINDIRLTILGLGGLTSIRTGTVTVDGTSLQGSISSGLAAPICYNTGSTLTLTGSLGAIQWYSTTTGLLVGTTSTLGTGNLTASDGYFTTVKNGVCPMVTTPSVSINVRPLATVTSINAQSGTICIGTAVTIAGIETGNNTIVGWQISTDNEVTWLPTAFTNSVINIASASSNSRESYRPLVQNGAVCSIVTVSGFATINPIGCTATVSFTGHPLATECLSNASTVGYNMIDATSSLAPKLAWSWNFGSGANPITANTSAPGIVTYNTSGPKQIRLTVTISGGNVFTTTVSGLGDFTLDALPDASTIASNSIALCSGNSLNLSISGVPTATTYAWERAATNTFASPTSLGSITTAGESMPSPTGTSSDYFYRLGVTNGACLVTNYSNVITVSSTLQPSASISYTLDNCKGNVGQSDVPVTVTTVAGGSFPYSFSSGSLGVSLNSSSGLISIASAPIGNHVVTLTASAFKGCNAFTTTTGVNINQNPTASFSYPNASYCENFGTVPVALFNTSGTTTTGNFFSNSALAVNAQNGEVTTNATPGNYSVFYALNATAGCPASTSSGVSFTINANPVANAPQYSNGLVYCNVGSTGGLSNSNTAVGTYLSNPSVGTNLNATTGVINLVGLTAQNYAISYSIAGTNTCASVQSTATGITVNQNPAATSFSYTNSNVCTPNATGPATVGISGGTFTLPLNAVNDNLSINNGNISSANSNATVGTTRNYTITYTLTVNGFGCQPANATTTISVSKQYPSIPFGYSTSARGAGGEMCAEGTATVTTTGLTGGAFSIFPPSGNIDANTGNVDLSKLNLGEYTVTYSIPGLSVCPAVTSSAIINTTSSGRADIVQANSGACQDQLKTFDLDPKLYDTRATIAWTESINNGVSNTLSSTSKELFNHTLVGAGLHTIKVSVKNGGCTEVTDFVDVRVDAYPQAGVINTIIPGDTLLCYEPNTGLTISGFRGDNFIWEYSKKEVKKDKSIALEDYKEFLAYNSKLPVATSPSFITNEDFTSKFYFRAKVYNGACTLGPDGKDVYTPVLIVSKCPQLDFIPNALTPNSADGNSFWDIQKLRLPENSIVTIFNRYGVEVYTMTGKDLQTRSFDGDGLPAGTYYYLIDYKSSEKQPVRGDLTIIR